MDDTKATIAQLEEMLEKTLNLNPLRPNYDHPDFPHLAKDRVNYPVWISKGIMGKIKGLAKDCGVPAGTVVEWAFRREIERYEKKYNKEISAVPHNERVKWSGGNHIAYNPLKRVVDNLKKTIDKLKEEEEKKKVDDARKNTQLKSTKAKL